MSRILQILKIPSLDPKDRPQKLIELVSQLPEVNQIVLQFLCNFLFRVSANSELNKMDTANIGTWFVVNNSLLTYFSSFGPNLLRVKDDDMEILIRDTPSVNLITQLLIEHNQEFLKETR